MCMRVSKQPGDWRLYVLSEGLGHARQCDLWYVQTTLIRVRSYGSYMTNIHLHTRAKDTPKNCERTLLGDFIYRLIKIYYRYK